MVKLPLARENAPLSRAWSAGISSGSGASNSPGVTGRDDAPVDARLLALPIDRRDGADGASSMALSP
jgi:hypothetical protein